MRIVIIEDEQLACERLMMLLKSVSPNAEVVAQLCSIQESVLWLQQNTHPDLIFADIQLADGFSFEIFKQIAVQKPIIFTTAFDQYALDAFSVHSIDYLIKPINALQLSGALQKYKSLCQPVTADKANHLLEALQQPVYKSRFLAKAGTKMFFVETQQIHYFFADGKMVYLVDTQGNKFSVDYTLERLEKLLDPKAFFRLNRSYLVHFGSILHVKPFINSRYKVLLKNGPKQEEVVMSREKVGEFREWAELC
jgi:DNA-binding LytR/AlgR family response regulator